MKFFDYVYYKCCQFYEPSDGSGTGISGLALLSVFQMFNIISVVAIIFQLFHFYIDINKYWYAIPAILLLVLNGIRYNKRNYLLLKEKWKDETFVTKKEKENGVIFYMIGSTVLVIAIIIWLANTNNSDLH